MSRTLRKFNKEFGDVFMLFRNPLHKNEEAKLRQLITDVRVEEYKLSGLNRVHKRLNNLPDAWDDIHIACIDERVNR